MFFSNNTTRVLQVQKPAVPLPQTNAAISVPCKNQLKISQSKKVLQHLGSDLGNLQPLSERTNRNPHVSIAVYNAIRSR